MTKEKKLITLLGTRQAKLGFTFVHEGVLKKCKECDFFSVCMENLEKGRIYKVIKIREKTLPCKVHENGTRVVEVIENDVEASLHERQALNGCVITFQPQECREDHCENIKKCRPYGLKQNDKCKVVKVREKITCPLNRKLFSVVLHRLHS
jgi:uncharacterized protein (UPF0179 family)